MSSIVTYNKHGRTSGELNEAGQLFVNIAATAKRAVVDVGCALGVATLPALAAGAKVIAIDLSEEHLNQLKASVAADAESRLTTIRGYFPGDIELEVESIDCVHASNVLHFLTGEELERAFEKIYGWLAPRGYFISISGTPYARNVARFIPEYERRASQGVIWPGECSDIHAWSDDPTVAELPKMVHLLDPHVLSKTAINAGLRVIEARMFSRRNTPGYIAFDGRENVLFVAQKWSMVE